MRRCPVCRRRTDNHKTGHCIPHDPNLDPDTKIAMICDLYGYDYTVDPDIPWGTRTVVGTVDAELHLAGCYHQSITGQEAL